LLKELAPLRPNSTPPVEVLRAPGSWRPSVKVALATALRITIPEDTKWDFACKTITVRM
jgi:hypothetical protein